MVRAWRSRSGFEGRSSLRTWLYRIATNICLDALRSQQRRARPMDLGPSSPAEERFLGPMDIDQPWVLPMPDTHCFSEGDPEASLLERESIRLAFVAALQHLPARQRAVLILADVLRWSAREVAQLLDTTVASVNSALQRARATLEACDFDLHPASGALGTGALGAAENDLLDQYVDAFEQYDVTRLALLLRDDVIQSMPPFAMWLEGPDQIARWMLGPGFECQGSRLARHRGQRRRRLRAVPPSRDVRRDRRWPSPVGPPGDRGVGRRHFGDPLLPRHRSLRRLRPPAPPRSVSCDPGPARSARCPEEIGSQEP